MVWKEVFLFHMRNALVQDTASSEQSCLYLLQFFPIPGTKNFNRHDLRSVPSYKGKPTLENVL